MLLFYDVSSSKLYCHYQLQSLLKRWISHCSIKMPINYIISITTE